MLRINYLYVVGDQLEIPTIPPSARGGVRSELREETHIDVSGGHEEARYAIGSKNGVRICPGYLEQPHPSVRSEISIARRATKLLT
jgi:hypothetical protein